MDLVLFCLQNDTQKLRKGADLESGIWEEMVVKFDDGGGHIG